MPEDLRGINSAKQGQGIQESPIPEYNEAPGFYSFLHRQQFWISWYWRVWPWHSTYVRAVKRLLDGSGLGLGLARCSRFFGAPPSLEQKDHGRTTSSDRSCLLCDKSHEQSDILMLTTVQSEVDRLFNITLRFFTTNEYIRNWKALFFPEEFVSCSIMSIFESRVK